MADSFELQMTDLVALETALAHLADNVTHILTTAMDETLRYLDQNLPPYPAGNAGELPKIYTRQPEPRPKRYTLNGKASSFKSEKQRRYFFWAVRAGIIELHSGAYQSKFKSRKQQGYFFWAMNSGKIQVPYQRTGKLQQEITTESAVTGDAVIGRIGTNIAYGPYVIGDETQQAPIHRGRWWQLADEVEQNLPDATRVFEEAAFREIGQALGST